MRVIILVIRQSYLSLKDRLFGWQTQILIFWSLVLCLGHSLFLPRFSCILSFGFLVTVSIRVNFFPHSFLSIFPSSFKWPPPPVPSQTNTTTMLMSLITITYVLLPSRVHFPDYPFVRKQCRLPLSLCLSVCLLNKENLVYIFTADSLFRLNESAFNNLRIHSKKKINFSDGLLLNAQHITALKSSKWNKDDRDSNSLR